MATPENPGPPTRGSRRRGRMAALAVAVILAVGGLSLVGYALAHQQGVPESAPAARGVADRPTSTSPPVPAVPDTGAATARPVEMSASPPASISIPAIGVSSPVNSVGLNPDRTLEVPAPGPLYDQAAWYRDSPTPGQIGPSIIIGHVDSAADGPSVFFDLARLTPGGAFTVTRADGVTLTFRIDAVRTYPKDAFPTQTVYGATPRPEMRLITCGGDFDSVAGSYRDNTVVFAHLLS